nr:unnamed protein product [Callosobruchus analis]
MFFVAFSAIAGTAGVTARLSKREVEFGRENFAVAAEQYRTAVGNCCPKMPLETKALLNSNYSDDDEISRFQEIEESSLNEYLEQYYPLPRKYINDMYKETENKEFVHKYSVRQDKITETFMVADSKLNIVGSDIYVQVQKNMKWLSYNYHRFEWSRNHKDCLHYEQLSDFMKNVVKNETVFVKGVDKEIRLERFVANQIIDLHNEGCPSLY